MWVWVCVLVFSGLLSVRLLLPFYHSKFPSVSKKHQLFGTKRRKRERRRKRKRERGIGEW